LLSAPNLINGSQLKDMFIAGSKWLKAHVTHVNALNVFPVPDGDTGTNMFLTLQAALKNIQPYNGSHAGDLSALASQGALMGARGNSGVILSQILDGFSQGIKGKEAFSTLDFAHALELASNKAYKAVINPVEGTILTVIKETARISHETAQEKTKAGEFLTELVEAAQNTLILTPELLPILKESGVVDSGGQGLVYFLEGMLRFVEDLPVDIDLDQDDPQTEFQPAPVEDVFTPGYGYDVQFLIKGDNLNIESIRHTIANMGDCPLVVGDEHTVKVHVHVPDPGVPISYGITQGILLDVVVENMEEQYREFIRQKEETSLETPPSIDTICVIPGSGLAKVFDSLGAGIIIHGGQTMNPSTQELLEAIEQTPSNQVFVLPNNSNIILTAQQASSMIGKDVRVIPSKTIPQGINALLAFNPEADFETNDHRMHNAITQVQTIEITQAVRSTSINRIQVNKGDIIGLLDDTLVATGQDFNQVSLNVINQVDVDELEIVTIYYGQDIMPETAKALSNLIGEAHSHLEVEIINGGQPHYHYIISLE
jgi:DAK2 domain fusion protein YloV